MGKSESEHNVNDHWCTPQSIWGPIVECFGEIGLDPFWNPSTNVPAKVRWTNWTRPEARITHVDWQNVIFGVDSCSEHAPKWDGYGLVFLNGPFSKAAKWLARAAQQGDEVIFLCKAGMNAQYIHNYALPADRLAFPRRRVTFDPHPFMAPGEERQTATFHVMLGYWGPRPELFERAFSKSCWVTRGKGAT